MRRADITLAEQFEKRKNWRDPLVDAVAATFLVRRTASNKPLPIMEAWEFLVTERVKGAEMGQSQAHHGGFMKVTDRDIYATAAREPSEEVGYELDPDHDLAYMASVGPELYRSELFYDSKLGLVLKVSSEEAEPSAGFALPLFLANVTGKTPSTETDGEVATGNWMSGASIVQKYGSKQDRPYSQFNYFQMLTIAILFLDGKWRPGARAVFAPGEYHFLLA